MRVKMNGDSYPLESPFRRLADLRNEVGAGAHFSAAPFRETATQVRVGRRLQIVDGCMERDVLAHGDGIDDSEADYR
jgi:hypothetical protein